MLTLAILGSAAVLDERVLGLWGREERKRSHLKNHHCLALGVESCGISRRSKGAPSSSPHFSKQSHPIILTRFVWVTSFSNAMQPKCSLRPPCRLTPRNPSQPLNPFCLNYTTGPAPEQQFAPQNRVLLSAMYGTKIAQLPASKA